MNLTTHRRIVRRQKSAALHARVARETVQSMLRWGDDGYASHARAIIHQHMSARFYAAALEELVNANQD